MFWRQQFVTWTHLKRSMHHLRTVITQDPFGQLEDCSLITCGSRDWRTEPQATWLSMTMETGSMPNTTWWTLELKGSMWQLENTSIQRYKICARRRPVVLSTKWAQLYFVTLILGHTKNEARTKRKRDHLDGTKSFKARRVYDTDAP